jgi:hypothetical protein
VALDLTLCDIGQNLQANPILFKHDHHGYGELLAGGELMAKLLGVSYNFSNKKASVHHVVPPFEQIVKILLVAVLPTVTGSQ